MSVHFSRGVAALIVAIGATACSGGGPPAPASPEWTNALEQVRGAVVSTAGYSPETVDITASPVHLRIFIKDTTLSQSDQATREGTAKAVAAAAETAMSAKDSFASIQVISIAIIHPGAADVGPAGTHTEDVIEFRKGPDQRFTHHIS